MELEFFINDKSYSLSEKKGKISLNDQDTDYKVHQIDETRLLIFYKNRSYEIEKVKSEGKSYQLKINGKLVDVDIKDHLDKILEKLGMDAALVETLNEVIAPMPGAILDVLVKEGDEVQQGDPLLILEAMKMENIIKSPGEGTVSKVNVEKGQNVEKGHALIIF